MIYLFITPIVYSHFFYSFGVLLEVDILHKKICDVQVYIYLNTLLNVISSFTPLHSNTYA